MQLSKLEIRIFFNKKTNQIISAYLIGFDEDLRIIMDVLKFSYICPVESISQDIKIDMTSYRN